MCEWLGEQFGVQQGRVYLDVHHEEPFGLHFVNVPAHWTTGGLHTRPSRLLASPLTPPALPKARTTTRCGMKNFLFEGGLRVRTAGSIRRCCQDLKVDGNISFHPHHYRRCA